MAAGKKRVDHVAWQIEVATNEEWEELTKLQGLVVVDVYSEWCGPCTAMASHLKEIKLQLGDDLLHCALAKADCITQLAKFRGRSEPTWLFLAGGHPVAMVRGANAPLIRKTLLTELQTEKEVLEDNNRQRVTLSWESLDVSNGNSESDKPNDSGELSTAPDNWLELDALTLQGSYRLIIEKLLLAMTERRLDVAAKSAVRLNKRECLILWFPSSVEDETLAEWFESTMKTLIEEVEPKVVVEEVVEEPIPSAEPEVEQEEPVEKNEETEENSVQVVEVEPEEPQYEAIEFRLYAEPEDKEALIKQLQQPEETEEEPVVTEPETVTEEEAPAEDEQVATEEEKPEEAVEEESTTNNNPENPEIVEPVVQNVEDVPEASEST